MNADTKQVLSRMASYLESLLLRKQHDEREAVRIYNLIMTLLQDAEVAESRATVELSNRGTPTPNVIRNS